VAAGAKAMDFKRLILKRRPFECTVMGVVFSFQFDEEACGIQDANGLADKDNAVIVLDPSLKDNPLLSTAVHEILETMSHKMEWNLPHKLISQLDILVSSMMDARADARQANP
jgi:hypothetical protein